MMCLFPDKGAADRKAASMRRQVSLQQQLHRFFPAHMLAALQVASQSVSPQAANSLSPMDAYLCEHFCLCM